ncbi:MAG: AMP-binding protein [Vicingaceae bacterium]
MVWEFSLELRRYPMASLTISGITIDYSELELNLERLPRNEQWQDEVYEFLESWFNDSKTIAVPTSGSTGKPKMIELYKEDVKRSAHYTLRSLNLEQDMKALICLPLSYIAGKLMLVRCLEGQLDCHIIRPSANPLQNISHRIDFTAITPYQLHHTLAISTERTKLSSISNVLVGGSGVNFADREVVSKFQNNTFLTYGMTETITHIALQRLSKGREEGSFKLIDPAFAISTDENGILMIHSPYNHMPLVVTNDIVELTSKNSFEFLGRSDLVINSGGVKIHPEQVEKKLEKLLDQKYLIGSLSHPSLGEQVILMIEGEEPKKRLKEQLKQNILKVLKPYERPKRIHYLESFTYTKTGKVDRTKTLTELK